MEKPPLFKVSSRYVYHREIINDKVDLFSQDYKNFMCRITTIIHCSNSNSVSTTQTLLATAVLYIGSKI